MRLIPLLIAAFGIGLCSTIFGGAVTYSWVQPQLESAQRVNDRQACVIAAQSVMMEQIARGVPLNDREIRRAYISACQGRTGKTLVLDEE